MSHVAIGLSQRGDNMANYNGRPSKNFRGGSNVHNGASISQSGWKKHGYTGQTRQTKKTNSGYGQYSALERFLLGEEDRKKKKKKKKKDKDWW